MTGNPQLLRKLFSALSTNIKPGLYHYISPPDDPRNYRLHLRIEPSQQGILIINAATVLHLNETATEYAYFLVHNAPAEQVGRWMARRYRVEPEDAIKDYRNLSQRVLTLIDTPDLDPVTFLDINRLPPYSGKLSAPYRLDIAITYQLQPGTDPNTAPIKQVTRELTTDEWKSVLDRAWKAGVPHVVFTGGEPTLRSDLIDLIAHAEYVGQVTGLITDGQKLVDPVYLYNLVQTGLDHIVILLNIDDPGDWVAIDNALKADIYCAVHLTVTPENQASGHELLKRLAALGVPAISLTASTPDLVSTLSSLRDYAAALQMTNIWDLPVPYSVHNPVAFETTQDKLPEGVGRAWLYIEPDGDVLPTQGGKEVLGNILNDAWGTIYHPK